MISRPDVVGFRVTGQEHAAIKAVAESLMFRKGDFLRLVTLRVVEELTQNDQKKDASGKRAA